MSQGPNYTTAAHAFVKATLRLGLRAPFVARNNTMLSQQDHSERIEEVSETYFNFSAVV